MTLTELEKNKETKGFPLIVFSHENNIIEKVDYSIAKGANAIEMDIRKEGDKIFARHTDKEVDNENKTEIGDFLKHLKENIFAKDEEGKSKGDKIVMWMFDLKESLNAEDVKDLRDKINEVFPDDVYKFYSIYKTINNENYKGTKDENKILLNEIKGKLGEFEGVAYDTDYGDSSGEQKISEILAWKDENNIKNFILSCGISAGDNRKVLEESLEEANKLCKKKKDFGVYSWVFDHLDLAKKELIEYNLNGVMGNFNFDNKDKKIDFENILNNLPEGFRLATREDKIGSFAKKEKEEQKLEAQIQVPPKGN